jgi:hypothetical protein
MSTNPIWKKHPGECRHKTRNPALNFERARDAPPEISSSEKAITGSAFVAAAENFFASVDALGE